MSDPCEFDCIDCGAHVTAFGLTAPPDPPRCAVCGWIAEVIPPNERQAVRDRLESR